ncbi:hypothetical protein [Actinokineospora diospyrosa]|nr:hypothetical protein [Actinokineospora diospyrosa]
MTRPPQVRFLRSAPTMAYPSGRLLAHQPTTLHVLAPDGWIHLGHTPPAGAVWITQEAAEQWCHDAGLPADTLATLPAP